MSDVSSNQHEDDDPVRSDKPLPEKVETRAEGRPPEERSSDDSRAQAEAILEESEERLADRSARSEP